MNKKVIITILLALVTMTGLAQTFTWRIEGTVANAAPTDTLNVIDTEKQRKIATLQVKDGNIIPTSGTLDEPAICAISKSGRRGWISFFVLESGTVNLTVDLDLAYIIRTGGTPMNDELMAVLEVQNNTDIDYDTYVKKMCEVVRRIVSNHPDHLLSTVLIGQSKALFTFSESIELIEKLSPNLQANPKMARLKELLMLMQETDEGKMFKELTGISPDGKPIALSDFVGRGSYVLAVFWASFCGPCMANMPNVIALYEKYKDRGLKVIGITVSEKPEKSNSVVQKFGIPFPQIYESKPMSTYGVTSIPNKILFAPDGTILYRRIKSDKEFERRLEEIFNNNK